MQGIPAPRPETELSTDSSTTEISAPNGEFENIEFVSEAGGIGALLYTAMSADTEDRRDMRLARDRDEGIIRDNLSAEFHRSIPIQKAINDSWLDAKNLKARIAEAIADGKDSVAIPDYIKRLSSLENLEAICEKLALSLGLSLDFEDRSSPGADKRDLVFWRE